VAFFFFKKNNNNNLNKKKICLKKFIITLKNEAEGKEYLMVRQILPFINNFE
jgi:hypothetical protein